MNKADNVTVTGAAADANIVRKLPYSPPELREFGSVAKLTLGGSGSGADGINNKKRGSDRRIKDDIVRIGEHPLGIGLYLFTYKASHQAQWGAGRQLGVMADEVALVLPEALVYGDDGFARVDYSMLVQNKDKSVLH